MNKADKRLSKIIFSPKLIDKLRTMTLKSNFKSEERLIEKKLVKMTNA